MNVWCSEGPWIRCLLAAALLAVALLSAPLLTGAPSALAQEPTRFGLVIHGGGGVMPREEMTPELEAAYRAALSRALVAGYEVLRDGGTSVDAVEAAIRVMEDSPLFNAGKGSSFNREGYNELDASIMDGRTLDAGGVAIVRHVRNPITAARLVMERSPHVLMAGEGADRFAREQGLEPVPQHYFWTERRWEALQRRLEAETPYGQPISGRAHEEYGTVGAAALDRHGNLAAGTSTGGRVAKLPGRVGDSPIIGAGTYADNATAALSSTGLGEFVLRVLGTKSVTELMAHRGLPLDDALAEMHRRYDEMGASIGMIGIDAGRNIAMRYSGDGMYRGYITEDGAPVVMIYRTGDEVADAAAALAAAIAETAAAFGRSGRQEQAAALVRDALVTFPDDVDFHFRQGYVFRYAGLFDASTAAYRRGLALDRDPIRWVSGEGQIAKTLVYQGDYEQALALQRGLAAHLARAGQEPDEKMLFYEGVMELYAGRRDRAVRLFDAAHGKDPASLWSAFGRAYRLAIQGDTAALLTLARELEGRDVADGERHYRLVHFYALAGDHQRALERLDTALEGGFFAYPYIRSDPLTASLHELPGFRERLRRIEARHTAFREAFGR